MSRLAWVTAAAALVASVLVGVTSAGPEFPARIDFPAGWAAEGIFGQGHTFWAGDTTNGAIFKGDVRTGSGSVLVPAAATGTKAAFGVFVDKWNRLWVAGGSAPTGLTERHAFVYDADTGALIKDILLTSAPGFGIINDVYVTKDAAYFTNTNNATNPQANVLFKVPLGKHGEIGTPTTVPITFFGANGIEATKNGKTLVVAGFSTGEYFTVDTKTGAVDKIDITENGAAASLPRGDGLVLRGNTLYIALNLPNAAFPGRCGDVAVVKLQHHMTTGEVVDHLNNPSDPLVNPATADLFGKYLYVIRRNALPGTCTVPPAAQLTPVRWLTRVDKKSGEHADGHAGKHVKHVKHVKAHH
jgi:hypothetical protein